MGVESLLPIFPLPLVLFPTIPLPLHIFEPRYKEMIGECLERNAVFGIIHGEARKQLLNLHKQLLALSGEKNPETPSEGSPALAFEVAAKVPLDLEFKQSLLGIRSEGERVSTLVAYYEALIPKITRALHIRTKAGGNGHAH